jgi:uncharacterized Zn finger protein (UPF0148 family)
MKHIHCDYCGFPAGSFKLIEGKNACIECQNRIYSVKHQKQTRPETVGVSGRVAESEPEVDMPERLSKPGRALESSRREHEYDKQLKFNWYE